MSLLLPSKKVAEHCRAFLIDRSSVAGSPISVRLIEYLICPEDRPADGNDCGCSPVPSPKSSRCGELHIALFPAEAFPYAKQFWQHSGLGISSRLAEHCLSMLPDESARPAPPSPTLTRPSKGGNKHYSAKGSISNGKNPFAVSQTTIEKLSNDQSVYLEERYGRNLPVGSAAAAKQALRRRIAGVLVRDSTEEYQGAPRAGGPDAEVGPSSRGVTNVTEGDVYLFPTGMSAIWNAHHIATMTRPAAKSVCFGYVQAISFDSHMYLWYVSASRTQTH